MPDLIPLRFFHYKEGKDENKLKELVAPPYDVISEEEKNEMKNKNPNNICHIILPESYEGAGQKLDEMIKNETIICGENRCICIYGIDYKRPDTGEQISRYGFVGLLRLVEIIPAKEGVIPHEATFREFTEDRLKVIQNTDSNFSPIFTIYNGNGTADEIFKKYVIKKPFLQTNDRDGFIHKIWQVWEEKDVKKLQEIVRNNSIIIADGHHRFITSLRHSKHGGCKYIMALFIDFNDPGLIIFPNHRQIHNLSVKNLEGLREKVKDFFEIEECKNLESLKNIMEKNLSKHVFGCYFQNKFLFLKLKSDIKPEKYIIGKHSKEWKNLNLPILHSILLKKCLNVENEEITFIKDINKGLENVNNENIEALFIINPTTLEEIQKITRLGEIMPQKSTYFYPKPLSGLVIHKHTDKIE